jgi:hypothetical protein
VFPRPLTNRTDEERAGLVASFHDARPVRYVVIDDFLDPEVARRLLGVHGGAVIFLVLWGLVVSGGMKIQQGAFPWQPGAVFADSVQYERSYMRNLVAGKIHVPKAAIEEERARRIRMKSLAEKRQKSSNPGGDHER